MMNWCQHLKEVTLFQHLFNCNVFNCNVFNCKVFSCNLKVQQLTTQTIFTVTQKLLRQRKVKTANRRTSKFAQKKQSLLKKRKVHQKHPSQSQKFRELLQIKICSFPQTCGVRVRCKTRFGVLNSRPFKYCPATGVGQLQEEKTIKEAVKEVKISTQYQNREDPSIR